ncbi:MAG TPA: ABC transporter substrate-binding protein [Acidobacteriota bacterium]|nr:ABC transporter substrate-binding protein [Acidobacteriota bacterium]
MIRQRFLKLSLLVIVFSVFLAGAGSHVFAAEKAITVTDFRGKTITFQKPVSRIVCLIESTLSGLYMLGQEQRVVGIPANVYQNPVFPYYAKLDERIRNKKLPAPGNWDFVSIESVIALKPDVVIIWSRQTEVIAALEERGVRVFGVFISNRDDVDRKMIALGRMTGSKTRAERLVSHVRDEVRRFSARIADVPASKRPGVYYMWAQGNLETSCGSSTVNDLITMSGGRNVCGHLPHEHLVVKFEQVIGWNPDVIVMWFNARKDPADVIADEQWRLVKAVRSKRVHELPEVFLCDLWTLKYIHAVKMVAKWTHPERFRDIDLKREEQRMLDMLYGGRLKKA